MAKILFDCTSRQDERPSAIQYLMNFRRKVERDDRQFTVLSERNGDGSYELTIKVSALRTGEQPKAPKDAPRPEEEPSEAKPDVVVDEPAKAATKPSTKPSAKPSAKPRSSRKSST